MARQGKSQQRAWLPADSALWQTCQIASDLTARRVPEFRVPTMFPLREHEVAFATGPVRVDSFYAAGDGSYTTSTTLMAGTGLFGLALGAATLAGSAMGNASRRARAAAAATPSWHTIVAGSVVVASQGFYLLDSSGKFDWQWDHIDLMQVVGFTTIVMQGRSVTGPVTWRIQSDWAELIFVLWAMARHPLHPQLVDQSWLPANWADWATAKGYPPTLPTRPSLSAP